MQSARGTLLLKLCRDQRLQSNRIFFQTFIMPTPIMYYKSLPSHSASWSHQYSTACFSFPRNKLIYILKKMLTEFTAWKSECLRNGVNGCSVNAHTQLCSPLSTLLQPSFLPTSVLETISFTPLLLHSLLFCSFSSFPFSPVKAVELKA